MFLLYLNKRVRLPSCFRFIGSLHPTSEPSSPKVLRTYVAVETKVSIIGTNHMVWVSPIHIGTQDPLGSRWSS